MNHTGKRVQRIASLLFLSSALALAACNSVGTEAAYDYLLAIPHDVLE